MRYVPAIVIAVGVTVATLYALYLTNDVSSLNGLWGMLLAVWAANFASSSKVSEEHERAFWSKDGQSPTKRHAHRGGDDVEV